MDKLTSLHSRVPLWLALAACAVSLAAGAALGIGRPARAQTPEPDKGEAPPPSEYPYLSARYGEAYIPSVAEWQAMRLTALGASTTRLDEHFNRQHVTCFATPKGLLMTLDLVPLPGWNYYQPGGRFSAPVEKVKPDLEKAVEKTLRFTRSFFGEVRDPDISLRLFINSEFVGAFEGGKLSLKAEEAPQK